MDQLRRVVMLAALAALTAQPARAMVNSYSPVSKDAVGALGLTSELATTNNWFCAATLVAESVVVTAGHCVTGLGYEADLSVRWRKNYDGTTGTIEAGPSSFSHSQVASWYLPPVGDVALGYLAHPVHHITPIPLTLEQVAPSQPVTLAGWGREGPPIGQGPMTKLRICQNEVLYVEVGQVNFCSAWNGACSYLCGPNSNDSGGPLIAGGLVAAVMVDYSTAVGLDLYADDPAFQALERPAVCKAAVLRGCSGSR